jgi:hypothetical protein
MYLKIYEKYKLLNILPENEYFIFSDVDLVVFEDELYNYIKPLLNNTNTTDIYFMKETDTSVNIGFMIIKNTQKVKNLFKNIIQDLEKRTVPVLDQTIINEYLINWTGKYEVLSEKFIGSTVNIDIKNKENFKNICLFQALCSSNKNYKLNILEKIIVFHYFFNINLQSYIDELGKTLENEDKDMFDYIIYNYKSISSLES